MATIGSPRPLSRGSLSRRSSTASRPSTPSGPRSLAQEVDHIKNLISYAGTSQHENNITAQLFRRPSLSRDQVTRERIFHELDSLKKRIRSEEEQSRRGSPAQGLSLGIESDDAPDPDPDDLEWERIGDDVPDEREEELESLRQELGKVRQEREDWLQNAEDRIDRLISEKEDLQDQITHQSEETKRTNAGSESLRRSLEEAEGRVRQLSEQVNAIRSDLEVARQEQARMKQLHEEAVASLNEVRQDKGHLSGELHEAKQVNDTLRSAYEETLASLHKVQSDQDDLNTRFIAVQGSMEGLHAQLKTLGEEKTAADHATTNANEKIAELDKLRSQMEVSLSEGVARISRLEEKNMEATEYIQKLIAEHKSSTTASKRDADALQEKYDGLVGEGERTKAAFQDLEAQLQAAKNATIASSKEDGTVKDELQRRLDDQTRNANEAQQTVRGNEEEMARLVEQRDGEAARVEALQHDLQETRSSSQMKIIERENELKHVVDDLKASSRDAQARFEAELARRDESVHELQETLRSVGTEHQAAFARLNEEQKAQIETSKSESGLQMRALGERLEDTKREHDERLRSLKSEHEGLRKQEQQAALDAAAQQTDRLRSMQGELDASRLALDEVTESSKASHELELASLRDQHSGALKAIQDELEAVRLSNREASDAMRASHERESVELRDHHAEHLRYIQAEFEASRRSTEETANTSKAAHERELEDLRNQHSEMLGHLQDKLEATIKESQEAASAVEARLEKHIFETKSRHVQEVEQIRAQVAQVESVAKDAVAAADSRHASQLTEISLTHSSEITALEQRLGQARDNTEKSMDSAKTIHEHELTEMRNNYEAELQALREDAENSRRKDDENARDLLQDHEVQLHSLRDLHDENLKSINEQLQQAQHQADESARGVRDSHMQELASSRAEHFEQIQAIEEQLLGSRRTAAEIEDKSKAELADLAGRLATEAQASRSLREQMQKAEESHRDRVRDLETSFAEAEQRSVRVIEELQDLRSSSESGMLQLNSSLDNTKNELQTSRTDLDTTREQLRASHAEHEGKVVELVALKEAAERAVKVKTAEFDQLHKQMIELREEDEKRAIEFEATSGQLSALEVKLKSSGSDSEYLRTQMTQLREQLELRTAELEQKSETCSELDQTSRMRASEVDQLKLEISKAHARGENQAAELGERSRACSALEGRLAVEVAVTEKLQFTVKRLHEESEVHKAELKDRSKQISDLHEKAAGEDETRAAQLASADEQREVLERENERLATHMQAKIDDLLTAHKEAESALHDERQELDTANEEIHDLRLQMEARVSELEGQRAELVAAIDEVRKSFDEAAASHEEALQTLKDSQSTATEWLASSHATELDRLRQEARDTTEQAGSDHGATLEALQRLHSEATEQARQANEERALEVSAQHSQELARLKTELAYHTSLAGKEHDELRNQHTGELVVIKADYEQRMQDLETSLESTKAKLAEAQNSHQQALKQQIDSNKSEKHLLQSEHAAIRAELMRLHRDEMSNVNEAHENLGTELQTTLSDHSARTAELQADLEEANARHEASSEAMQKAHAETLESVKLDHDRRVEDLTRAHQVGMDEIAAGTQAGLATSRAEHQAMRDELANTVLSHNRAIESLKHEHEVALENARLERGIVAKKHDDAMGEKAEELRATRAEFEQQKVAMKQQHEQKLADVAEANQSAITAKVQEHASERHEATEKTNIEAERMRRERQEEVDKLKVELHEAATAATGAREEHARRIADMDAAAGMAKQEHDKLLETRLAEAEVASAAAIAALHSSHAQALVERQKAEQVEIGRLAQSHEQDLAEVRTALMAEFDAAQLTNKQQVEILQGSLHARLEDAKAAHEESLADHDEAWASKLTRLRDEHDAAIATAVTGSHESATTSLEEARRQHSEALERAVREAQQDANTRARDAEEQHASAMEKAVADSREAGTAEIETLKASHAEALEQMKVAAEERVSRTASEEEQRHGTLLAEAVSRTSEDLETKFNAELVSQQENFASTRLNLLNELAGLRQQHSEAADGHSKLLLEKGEEHEKSAAELQSRLQEAERHAMGVTQSHNDLLSEFAELQVRLEVANTRESEAQNVLDELSQQSEDHIKQVDLANSALEDQIAGLRAQNAELIERNQQAEIYTAELRAKVLTDEGVTSNASREVLGQLNALKEQLDILDKEREEAEAASRRKAQEKDELARQNDFLVNEISSMMATLSNPKSSRPLASYTDAAMQTDHIISLPGSRTHTPRSSVELNGARSPRLYDALRELRAVRSPRAVESSEPKADIATLEAARASRRPSTPAKPSEPRRSRKEDRAWKTQSFEDYLQQAQAELSELGSVISANETLFAQKIQEHVGDLQRAKDQLAATYKQKFDALLHEKKRMEKDINTRQAADFARERNQLVASYGQSEQALPSKVQDLPSRKARALKSAEERLVVEYNRRIAKRQSQIALKHAEEFQSLTEDYDRKMAELLADRTKLEGDLSVEPSKFEEDLDDFDVKSDKLEAEKSNSLPSSPQAPRPSGSEEQPNARKVEPKSSRSALPRRVTPTSLPRTNMSIPKAVAYPGNRDGPDATSAPYSPRKSTDARRTASDRYAPEPQRSLLRTKSPPLPPEDRPMPRRIVTNPRTSSRRASTSFATADPAQNAGVGASDPDATKAKGKQRASMDGRGQSPTAEPRSPRSLRHSSAMMFPQHYGET